VFTLQELHWTYKHFFLCHPSSSRFSYTIMCLIFVMPLYTLDEAPHVDYYHEDKEMNTYIHIHHWNEVRILPSYCSNPIAIHPTQHDICINMYSLFHSLHKEWFESFKRLFSNNVFSMCYFEFEVKFCLHNQISKTQLTQECNFIYDTNGLKDFMVLCCISSGLPFETFHVLCTLLVLKCTNNIHLWTCHHNKGQIYTLVPHY
jgi:hypothetical protein